MFDDLIKEIERLEKGIKVSVPIEADKEGFLDKECPSKECLTQFKVNSDDWGNIVRDEEVFCPICRFTAPAQEWFTTEQVERAQEIALAQFNSSFNNALEASASKFNRRQPKNSFISITMQYKGKLVSVPMPPAATDPMQLKISCSECGCRYAVIGAGFFCPSCGYNCAEKTFSQSIQKARDALGVISQLEKIEIQVDRDHTENAKRMILEKCIETGVMSFQRAVEVLYKEEVGEEGLARNIFQRLVQGSDLWKQKFGKGYSDILSGNELKIITISFQQRHLLSHCEGIVDQDYIDKSGDARYAVGQRISLKKEGVLDFLNALDKLFEGLKKIVNKA